MKETKETIRDFDNFAWDFGTFNYTGIPMKHFCENWHRYERIPHDKDCPTPFHEPYFLEMQVSRGNNTISSYTPERFNNFDEVWDNWHRKISKDDLEDLPLKHTYRYAFVHTVKDPPPLSPAKVQQEQETTLFMVSPEKCYIYSQNFGKNYTFCDRFIGETLLEMT